MPKPDFLKSSLITLNQITKESYNDEIRPTALALWKKLLQAKNPQWKYITAKAFSINNESGKAHVIALFDKRLPDIGLVGYFACTNSTTGAKALVQAAEWLKKTFNIHDIYGPVNGTLPSDYRINLNSDFIFPGEPVNPPWHLEAFEKAGFNIFNRYVSGRARHYQLLMKSIIRKPAYGYEHISIKLFNNKNYDHDFKIYHELRNKIFPLESIYCPVISLEERIYNTGGKFDPSYTYFLVDRGTEVGFIMAYAYDQQLIVKSIGMLPGYRGKRLAGKLLKPVHDRAKREGLKVAIYAMIRVGNRAYRMKRPGVKVFRRYVTMHKNV